MGSLWSQQGCLKISPAQGLVRPPMLKVGKVYDFKKAGQRLFMIDTPIDLLSDKWQAIAKILVTQITVTKKFTAGKYKILKIYNPEEAKIISFNQIPYYKFR